MPFKLISAVVTSAVALHGCHAPQTGRLPPAQNVVSAPDTAKAATHVGALDTAKAKYGGVILFWGDKGIDARTPQLSKVAQLTTVPSSYPFVNAAGTELYYLATRARQVRQMTLRTGEDRLLVQLPRLTNRCFDASSPFEQIQSGSDVRWDERKGELCFDIGDRNENMVRVKMNFSVDLRAATVRSAYTAVFDGCEEQGVTTSEPVCSGWGEERPVRAGRKQQGRTSQRRHWPYLTQDRLVALGLTAEHLEDPSPSGRWFRFYDFEAEGDDIYSAILFFDALEGKVYGVDYDPDHGIPDKTHPLRAIEYGRLRGQTVPPSGLCLVPAERTSGWAPFGDDIFLLDSCVAGVGVFTPPGRMQVVDAAGFILLSPVARD